MAEEPSLLDYAFRWEKATPDRVWLTQPVGDGRVRTYTWSEALDEARRMAAHLRSFEFERGSRIAIMSKNCAEFILAELAIWMSGHTTVALYPTLAPDSVRYILEHSDSQLVFVGKLDGWEEMAPGVPEQIPRVAFTLAPETEYETWSSVVSRTVPVDGTPTRNDDELAAILYTSGSTGKPKGVMHSFGRISRASRINSAPVDLTQNDRVLSYLPLAHAMERGIVECLGLLTGFEIYFTESIDTFVQDLARARPTVFASVPRLWLKFQLGVYEKMPPRRLERLLRIPVLNRLVKKKILANLGLDRVRFALSGSAPIPPELVRWYNDLGLELLEGYGMTENFCCSHLTLPGEGRIGYVGRALDGVEVRISEAGEILVKSPGQMTGYFGEPELTADSYTEDGFFKTGDRGEVDSEGRLKITGRVKELFKTSKGKYVAPAPIENLLNIDPNVELSCVSGVAQPQPFALVAPAEDIQCNMGDPEVRQRLIDNLEQLLTEVNSKLESFERLQFIAIATQPWVIENGFLTPTMKIKRANIEEHYSSLIDPWYATGERVVWETGDLVQVPRPTPPRLMAAR